MGCGSCQFRCSSKAAPTSSRLFAQMWQACGLAARKCGVLILNWGAWGISRGVASFEGVRDGTMHA